MQKTQPRGTLLRHLGVLDRYQSVRDNRRARPCEFIGLGAVDVTTAYKLMVYEFAKSSAYEFTQIGSESTSDPLIPVCAK